MQAVIYRTKSYKHLEKRIISVLIEFLFPSFQHHNFQAKVRIPASTLVARSRNETGSQVNSL